MVGTWRPTVRAWLARLDHGGVYLPIAGMYTPFGLLVMSTEWAVPVLSVVWGGALVAILLKLVWVHAPKWLSATVGVGLGWVGAAPFSQLSEGSAAWPVARRRRRSPLHGWCGRVRASAPGRFLRYLDTTGSSAC
jgi:predicted membrane channel-forming protein YqfA (hemolysin III family)